MVALVVHVIETNPARWPTPASGSAQSSDRRRYLLRESPPASASAAAAALGGAHSLLTPITCIDSVAVSTSIGSGDHIPLCPPTPPPPTVLLHLHLSPCRPPHCLIDWLAFPCGEHLVFSSTDTNRCGLVCTSPHHQPQPVHRLSLEQTLSLSLSSLGSVLT